MRVRGGAPRWPAALGAKLGAIRGGSLRTAVDADGLESLSFRAVWTAADGCGRRLEIYGSEGWGFESLRACWETSVLAGDFAVDTPWTLLTFGSHSLSFL